MAETIYKIGNKILKIGGKLLTVHYDNQTYTKSYSGEASATPSGALSSEDYIDLEPSTYHIEFSGTFTLYQSGKYTLCQVAIFGDDDPTSNAIHPAVTFTYVSPDTKTVTIEGSADIDLTQHPDLKYFAFLRDSSNIMGTVVGTITATRHT